MKQPQTLMTELLTHLRYRHCIVALSHSDYRTAIGGTEKVLHEEQALLAERGVSYIQVFPLRHVLPEWREPTMQLVGINVDSQPLGYLTPMQARLLLGALAGIGVRIAAVHVHHLLGMAVETADEILRDITAEIRFFIHDYYSICPQINLLKNGREYCGAPEATSQDCRECEWGEMRIEHFAGFQKFFEERVGGFFAPSEVAKRIWGQSFPHLEHRVRVVPHQVILPDTAAETPTKPNQKLRIAFVGYQAQNKGWHAWARFAQQTAAEGAPYELYHLGACHDRLPNVHHVMVSFVDDGPDAMIQALRKHAIDIVFLWSICPETYSYTLFESLAAGCYVVTNPMSGNIAAQVDGTSRGIVIEDEARLHAFFREVATVAELVAANREAHRGFALGVNPLLADETAAALESPNARTDDAFERVERFLAQEPDLRDRLERERRVASQLMQFVEQLRETQEYAGFLQSKHDEKDAAIEALRAQGGGQVRSSLRDRFVSLAKRVLNRFPRLKGVIKRFLIH